MAGETTSVGTAPSSPRRSASSNVSSTALLASRIHHHHHGSGATPPSYTTRPGLLTKNQFYATSPAVVFDFGTRLVKAGFAGETSPRCIIPAKALLRIDNDGTEERERYYADCTSSAERRRILEQLVRKVFINHLLNNMVTNQRRVVIVESPLTPMHLRCDITYVMFEIFKVLSIMFVPSNLAALTCVACDTGLVIDLGNRKVSIIPTVDGATIQTAWRLRRAGSAEHMRQFLYRNFPEVACARDNYDNKPFNADQFHDMSAFYDDILARACFATTVERAGKHFRGVQYVSSETSSTKKDDFSDDLFPPPKGAKFICHGQEIHVQGRVFELCLEQLFGPDEDNVTLAELILESLAACPIDCRRRLVKNLLITGGIAHLPNVQHRTAAEIQHAITKNPKFSKLFGNIRNEFLFFELPCLPNYAAWLGGSIVAYSDFINQRSISRQTYLQRLKQSGGEILLPDWSEFDEGLDELRTPFVVDEKQQSESSLSSSITNSALRLSQRMIVSPSSTLAAARRSAVTSTNAVVPPKDH